MTTKCETPIVRLDAPRKCSPLAGSQLPPVTPNLTDARRQWLSELYETNSTAVFNLCRRLLNSREDAADATHEVFLRAVASLSEPPTSPRARAWLMMVARNHCIDLLRRRDRFGIALTTLAATTDSTVDSLGTVEDRELLVAVLERLGGREREALWQSAVERRSLAEIARSLGLSYMAAAKLLSRARQHALLLATRLAVILGLAQLGRAVQRWSRAQSAQQVAAAVVVPLLIAAVVVSSGPHPALGAAAGSRPTQGPSVGHHPTHAGGQLPGTGPAPLDGTGALAQALGVQTAAVPPVSTPVSPTAIPPVASDTDKDHGKGHDKDDLIPRHRGQGMALAHRL